MPKEELVNVSAKVSAAVKSEIEKKAREEERSVSQIVARLLSTHPAIKQSEKDNRALVQV